MRTANEKQLELGDRILRLQERLSHFDNFNELKSNVDFDVWTNFKDWGNWDNSWKNWSDWKDWKDFEEWDIWLNN